MATYVKKKKNISFLKNVINVNFFICKINLFKSK